LDEFSLIDRIKTAVRARAADPRVVLGIGDDAAVLDAALGRIAVTTDAMIEGVHFGFDLCSPADVGERAVAVNLSDLAAMGARPLALLFSLEIPRSMDDGVVLAVMRAAGRAAARHSAPVVGGNVTSTPGPFGVTVTALGDVAGDAFLTRSGARPGDAILVSGPLGAAALGLILLRDHPGHARSHPSLVRSYRRPAARVELGMTLGSAGGVHAAIDVSDGLLADLGHVLDASKVGARIDVERIPLPRGARRVSRDLGLDPLDAALSGGDDYELLVFADPAEPAVQALRRVGTVTKARGLTLHRDGKRMILPDVRGYRHRK